MQTAGMKQSHGAGMVGGSEIPDLSYRQSVQAMEQS